MMTFNYDEIADVLYITFGNPQKAFVKETKDGLLLRYARNTRRLCGITIAGFSEQAAITVIDIMSYIDGE